eukprot:TRINITY_DN2572_c0_g1_i1.p1 TRINITY_DN2572_c0_g1~~TRINITY_DN2572_c0_g1_i1.p1  ORF type:complete len:617 (+),score=140.04 TRINITY_DN2572_c0_g1_i1:316-2166(+)
MVELIEEKASELLEFVFNNLVLVSKAAAAVASIQSLLPVLLQRLWMVEIQLSQHNDEEVLDKEGDKLGECEQQTCDQVSCVKQNTNQSQVQGEVQGEVRSEVQGEAQGEARGETQAEVQAKEAQGEEQRGPVNNQDNNRKDDHCTERDNITHEKIESDDYYVQLKVFVGTLVEGIQALTNFINQLDDDILFFGNHQNDQPENAMIREIGAVWNSCATLGILTPEVARTRAKRDEDRYTFYLLLQSFFADIKKGHVFVIARKAKEKQRLEKEKRMAITTVDTNQMTSTDVENVSKNRDDKKIKDQVENQVENQTRSQFENQIQNEAENQIQKQVKNLAENRVENLVSLENPTENHIKNQCKEQVEEQVENPKTVENHVENNTADECENEIETDKPKQYEKQIESQTENQMTMMDTTKSRMRTPSKNYHHVPSKGTPTLYSTPSRNLSMTLPRISPHHSPNRSPIPPGTVILTPPSFTIPSGGRRTPTRATATQHHQQPEHQTINVIEQPGMTITTTTNLRVHSTTSSPLFHNMPDSPYVSSTSASSSSSRISIRNKIKTKNNCLLQGCEGGEGEKDQWQKNGEGLHEGRVNLNLLPLLSRVENNVINTCQDSPKKGD